MKAEVMAVAVVDYELVVVLVDGEMIAVVAVDSEVVGLLLVTVAMVVDSEMVRELGCWLR